MIPLTWASAILSWLSFSYHWKYSHHGWQNGDIGWSYRGVKDCECVMPRLGGWHDFGIWSGMTVLLLYYTSSQDIQIEESSYIYRSGWTKDIRFKTGIQGWVREQGKQEIQDWSLVSEKKEVLRSPGGCPVYRRNLSTPHDYPTKPWPRIHMRGRHNRMIVDSRPEFHLPSRF